MNQRKECQGLFVVSYFSKAEALVWDAYSVKSTTESYNVRFGCVCRDYLLCIAVTDVEMIA